VPREQEWCHNKGNNADELDQDIEGWPGGIFEGIAYGITNDSGLMSIGVFTAQISEFDIFFGIIPCTTGIRHKDRHEYTCDGSTGQQAA
jgi:hypothetical protein